LRRQGGFETRPYESAGIAHVLRKMAGNWAGFDVN
jgi:hypothetical protein